MNGVLVKRMGDSKETAYFCSPTILRNAFMSGWKVEPSYRTALPPYRQTEEATRYIIQPV